MGDKSAIEWTDATWNPIIGCTRVSEGCRNCYAERTAIRQASANRGTGRYFGLVKSTFAGPRWTGEVRLVESVLDAPLRWTRPRRIFVNSMGDLFHEDVEVAWLDRVYAVMAASPQHTFQVLTKRPRRMEIYNRLRKRPLPNVWLGVSVEDQATADERVPLLLRTPAAVRFVSYEPALGPVDFSVAVLCGFYGQPDPALRGPLGGDIGINWIVVGGESGPGARPFDLAWARSTVAQCREAAVPVFVKQLGARPLTHGPESWWPPHWNASPPPGGQELKLRDRKGGDPAEWPEDLRVREYPAMTASAVA